MEYTQNKLESVTDDDVNLVECPGCGRSDFKSNKGVAIHHKKEHDFSVAMLFRCKDCGEIKSADNSDQKYCTSCNWNDEDDAYLCPYDGCEREFSTRNGRSVHHNRVHGESIAGYEYECQYEECDNTFTSIVAPDSPDAPKYCPVKELDEDEKSCEAKARTGNSRTFSDEWKQKISEGMEQAIEEGRAESPLANATDEWRQENIFDKRDNSYLHEPVPEEQKKRQSETLKEGYRTGRIDPPKVKTGVVEETGHEVDSDWEKEIDLLLHHSDLDFKYNSEDGFVRFDLGDCIYVPDFIVGDVVIEVKSDWTYGKRTEKAEKSAKFVLESDEWKYWVVGNFDKLPCDKLIRYDEREKLIEHLEERQ